VVLIRRKISCIHFVGVDEGLFLIKLVDFTLLFYVDSVARKLIIIGIGLLLYGIDELVGICVFKILLVLIAKRFLLFLQ
jgi:hypothetical protein